MEIIPYAVGSGVALLDVFVLYVKLERILSICPAVEIPDTVRKFSCILKSKKICTESEDFSIKLSHKKKMQSTQFSVFRERRAKKIQVRRGMSVGSSSPQNIVCHLPMA